MSLLLEWTWKSTILLGLVWLAASCLRAQTAALRHRLWALALAGLVLAPAISLKLPAWHSRLAPVSDFRGIAREQVPGNRVTVVGQRAAAHRIPWILIMWILIIWCSGSGTVLLRLLAGTIWVNRGRQSLADDVSQRLVSELRGAFGVGRRVRLVALGPDAMPMTWGFFRPSIGLPANASSWTEERRRMVISHELAHIGRSDWAWQMAAEIARAMYWFHPLVWLAARRLRRESELACDDAVLNAGVPAAGYVGELLSLSQTLKNPGWLCSSALAVAPTSDLERRFQSVLNPLLNRRRLSQTVQILTAFAVLAVLIPLAALRAPAQAQTAKLSGSIFAPDGSVVPNATVVLIDSQTQESKTMQTRSIGNYTFDGVRPGSYEFRVMMPGFQVYSNPGMALNAGQEATLNVSLSMGQVNEMVEVLANGVAVAGAGRPMRVRVGGNVQATRLLNMVKPVYPEEARAAGVEGSVILEALIGVDGRLIHLHVLKSMGSGMDEAALAATRQWLYQPTLLNGRPVEVTTNITVDFKLAP